MSRKRLTSVALLLCSFSAADCLADVVPISSSQQINGSGSVLICGPFSPENFCPVVGQNSFSGAPGSATTSGVAFGTEWDLTASVSLEPVPDPSVTSNNINVQMGVFASVNGIVKRGGGSAEVSNIYDLKFDLTSSSVMHLTGSADIATSGLVVSSSAVPQILLSGPGFQFQVPPPYGTLDFWFTLQAGMYDLTASTEASLLTDSNYSGFSFSDAALSLNADFTAIPEPIYTPLVLATLIVGWCCVRRRYHSV